MHDFFQLKNDSYIYYTIRKNENGYISIIIGQSKGKIKTNNLLKFKSKILKKYGIK